MPELSDLEKILANREAFIDNALSKFTKSVKESEKKLLNMVLKEYVSKFDYKDNIIVFGKKNLNNINEIDKIFEKFYIEYSAPQFEKLAKYMVELANYSDDYFKTAANVTKITDTAQKNLDAISERVGIAKDGTLIPNSYIDRLAKSDIVKEELKDYVASSISTNTTSLTDFQKGFETLIQGTDKVEGKLLRYWKTETHDTMFSVSRANDDVLATALKMEFFVYLPGTIKTSRPFCIHKVGKCFNRKDAMKWSNQKGEGYSYNPLIDMGGWNCRHQPYWISNAMAKSKYPDKYFEYYPTKK